jgi:geranylgeranyl pyrophosphate synthase
MLIDYRTGDVWAPKLEMREALAAESQHFAECVHTGKEPWSSGKAGLAVAGFNGCAPARSSLEAIGRAVLKELGLPETYLGFAMVTLNNAYWQRSFAAVPFNRRIFLLPHCLRDQAACAGTYDTLGLHCRHCGRCLIHDLQTDAEALGYRVIVAEGTSAVGAEVLGQERDAVLGVACLDSLEKSFGRVADLGIPHLAVPLLSNGCVNTRAEVDVIRRLLNLRVGAGAPVYRSFVPLLRESARLFEKNTLADLLAPYLVVRAGTPAIPEGLALNWLREGGKRLRPFVTLATYAVARHGAAALLPDARLNEMIPRPVRQLALAIEVLHKGSLVHDDIEDDSEFRYGKPCLHRAYGRPAALAVGYHLVALGYRLMISASAELGPECSAGVLAHLTAAHLDLCRGQGAELLCEVRRGAPLRAAEVLALGALKTAPAFETAIHAGLCAAGACLPPEHLRRYAAYMGEGYQVLNDLDDWRADSANKVTCGNDVLMSRPTILRALTLEAGGGEALARAAAAPGPAALVAQVRAAYEQYRAFERAGELVVKLRDRALREAARIETPLVGEIFGFLARIVLVTPSK